MEEQQPNFTLSQEHQSSLLNYQSYLSYCNVEAPIKLEGNPLLDFVSLFGRGDCREISKQTSHLRDEYKRTAAHYIALFYGLNGLATFKDMTLRQCLFSLDEHGMTPGHYAVFTHLDQKIDPERMSQITDLRAQNRFGHSILEMAQKDSNKNFAQSALELPFLYSQEVEDLHFLASRGNVKELCRIIGRDGNILLNWRDHESKTPLHVAVIYGRYEVVQALIERGANVNAIDYFGNTPLHYSILHHEKAPCEKTQANNHEESFDDQLARDLIWDARKPKEETQQFIRAEGLLIQYALCKAGADFCYKNKEGKAPSELIAGRKLANILVLYKMWRHIQKYDPSYLVNHVQACQEDIVAKDFSTTLLAKTNDQIRSELDIISEGLYNVNCNYFFSYKRSVRQHYSEELCTALMGYLRIACPPRSMNPLKLVSRSDSHHRDLADKLSSQLGNFRSYDQYTYNGFPDQFKLNAAHYILTKLISGPQGALKRAMFTILSQQCDPNDPFMKFLSTVQLLLKEAAEKERVASEHKGFSKSSQYGW